MEKRTFLLFVLLVLITPFMNAQSFIVKGRVISGDDSEPLIGVAVVQEGTTNGVTTDFDGNYIISA